MWLFKSACTSNSVSTYHLIRCKSSGDKTNLTSCMYLIDCRNLLHSFSVGLFMYMHISETIWWKSGSSILQGNCPFTKMCEIIDLCPYSDMHSCPQQTKHRLWVRNYVIWVEFLENIWSLCSCSRSHKY